MYRRRVALHYPATSLFVIAAMIGIIGYLVWLRWNPHERSLWLNQRSVEDYLNEYDERQRRDYKWEPNATTQGVERTDYVPTKYRRKRLTKKQRRIVCQRSDYKCVYCHHYVPVWNRELNHREPLWSDLYRERDLNDLSNFELCCRSCHGYLSYRQAEQRRLLWQRRQR